MTSSKRQVTFLSLIFLLKLSLSLSLLLLQLIEVRPILLFPSAGTLMADKADSRLACATGALALGARETREHAWRACCRSSRSPNAQAPVVQANSRPVGPSTTVFCKRISGL